MKRFAFVVVFMFFVTAIFAQIPSEVKPLMTEGGTLWKAKKYEEALLKFQEANEAAPDNQIIISYIGVGAYKVKKYDLALESYKTNLENGFKSEKSYKYIVDILKNQENFEEMKIYVEKGLKQYATNKDLLRLAPICYVNLGAEKYSEALELQEELAPLSQTEPDKYKVEIEKANDIFKEALEITTKAYTMAPTDKSALQAMLAIYQALNDETNVKKIEKELGAVSN